MPSSFTVIGPLAFLRKEDITNVAFLDSVETIGEYVLAYCYALTTVDLPLSLTTIEKYVFCDCVALTTVVLPPSLTTMEWWEFKGFTALTNINLPSSITHIKEDAFEGCLQFKGNHEDQMHTLEFYWLWLIPCARGDERL